MNRSYSTGEVGPVEGDGRTVPVKLVAWGYPERVTDDGRLWYHEQFERGDITPAEDKMLVRKEHNGPVVGRIAEFVEREDGPYAMVRVIDTPDGRDTLAMLDEKILEPSIEFDHSLSATRAGELIRRAKSVLTGLAFTLNPQYKTAAVLGRRSNPQEPPMSDPTPTPAPAPEPTPTPTPAPAPEPTPTPTPEPVDQFARSSGVRRLQPEPAPTPAPVGRFRSLGEFARATALGEITIEERQKFFRALSVAGVSDAPGLFGQEAWINEIIDLRRIVTPALSLFSTRPLPDKGMTINQPTIIQHPLVGVVGDLEQIPSRKMKIGSTSWTVETYAGGQGTSIVLIERSDPAYLTELMRLFLQEMLLDMEGDVAAAILAAADDTHAAQEVDTSNQNHVDAFIDGAALLLSAATIQSPPEALGLSIDMWKLLAKAKDTTGRKLFPGLNPMNASGTTSLKNPDDGSVMDLAWSVVPSWSGKVAVMGVRNAFRTMVGTLGTIQSDVPENLSRENAVYQPAAFGAVDTAGLVKIIDS